MDFKRLMAGVALSMTTFAGCYGSGDAIDETGETTEDVSRSRAWEHLVGAWQGDTGAFHGLVFTATAEGSGHHWFADVDNGVRCIRAPCPSESRVEGVFTATSRTLNLRSADPRLGVPTGVYGTYNYTLRGDVLTLTQGGRAVARLHKLVSYCAEADDCAEQRLVAPRCVGAWTCTAAHACSYVCGRPPAGEGAFCGGIAGIRCADGLTCVLSGSYPDAGGTCRRPVTRCATVRCASGTHCVEDASGARCVADGVRCGNTTCPSGQYCCNPLRSICARMGVLCIQ